MMGDLVNVNIIKFRVCALFFRIFFLQPRFNISSEGQAKMPFFGNRFCRRQHNNVDLVCYLKNKAKLPTQIDAGHIKWMR